MNEYYHAPVALRLRHDVQPFNNEWSYQVKMDFSFEHHDDYFIKDEILVEMGVYTFNTENHARIQAKRICKEFEDYFRNGLGDLIIEVMEI